MVCGKTLALFSRDRADLWKVDVLPASRMYFGSYLSNTLYKNRM